MTLNHSTGIFVHLDDMKMKLETSLLFWFLAKRSRIIKRRGWTSAEAYGVGSPKG
jgi:hypothetical protein